MAVAQVLVPLVAMLWVPLAAFLPSVPGILVLNSVFVMMWLVSAMLFSRSGERLTPVATEVMKSN
jgi:hypothetical protein